MPSQGPNVTAIQPASVPNLVTDAETVVATLGGVSTNPAVSTVLFDAFVNLSPGTAATAITLSIREGSLTGAVVATADAAVVATQLGLPMSVPLNAVVPLGDVSDAVYVLTAQVLDATGNTPVFHVVFSATVY